jgi:hypothetical protein
MCSKIDVMEKERKKLKFGGELNKTLVHFPTTLVAPDFYAASSAAP